MVGALAGCGGSDNGTAAAPPGGGAAPPPAAGVTAPTGTAPVTLSSLTAAEVAALTPVVTVGSVTIASPPQVSFAISDGATTDNPILGFGAASSTGSLSYLRFALAKLVPGTSGSPSKWVSYIVTSTTPGAAQRPSTDNTGTMVDNGNGTYTYTFARDITKAKDEVAAMTLTAPNVAADLGDLSYDPNLTHRLVIQLSGGGIANPVNAIYDFIPATGKTVASTDTQRQVVSIDSCNRCHEKLAFHGSARIDTQYCVVCHTDQRKYGRENVASTALAFPALTETATVNATTGITSYRYEPRTYVADGEVSGNFTTLVHKIHQGKDLVKQNYHYAGVVFNNKGFSMLGGGQKMCTVCHDNTKAAQADNWNTVPSRLACGACHDGINFATGAGTTLGGATTGHVGKAQSNDGTCALCHASADIKTYHQTENITEHNPTIAAGLASFTYEVKSAAVDATSNDLTIVFKISQDGTALAALPPTGFTGSPSFLLAWAEAQDGITTPIDFNNKGGKLAQPKTAAVATGLTGPDADGYFTSVIPGASAFPVGAKMRTVALQGYYTQAAGTGGIAANTARHAVSAVKTVTGDTERRKVVDAAKCSNCHEWFEGHGGNRVFAKESTSLVCVLCHVPGMTSSGRSMPDAELNALVFTGEKAKILADWGFDNTLPNAALNLPVTTNNMKDMIHGIHKGRERVTPFMDARYFRSNLTLLDFRRMDFPGKINNCETCHIAGTYSNVSTNALASTYESIDAAYAAGIAGGTATTAMANTALNTANDEDKVVSPFAAACISCHDSVAAQSHAATQGGLIQGTRTAFQTKVATPGAGEACLTCHGAGKAEDVAVKHK
jgi:OmcA/MtrC family decaheme c-type cytochrome